MPYTGPFGFSTTQKCTSVYKGSNMSMDMFMVFEKLSGDGSVKGPISQRNNIRRI